MPIATSETSGSPPVVPSTLPTAAEHSVLAQDEGTDFTPKADHKLVALLPGSSTHNPDTTILPEPTNNGTIAPKSELNTRSKEQTPQLLDRLLSAVSNASETTLIAGLSAVALLMSTVLGKFGLLIVGAFLGAMLHAALQNQNGLSDVVKSLAKPKDSMITEEPDDKKPREDVAADFSSLDPKVGSALDELCNAVVKDYINSWYMTLIPDDSSFPATCHHYLSQTFLRFSKHMNNKRPADVFFWSVINISGTMTTFMQDLSRALGVNRELRTGVQAYISANPRSDLADLVHRGAQDKKLRELSSDIIQQFAPRDLKNSEPVSLFLKNIVRSAILWNMVERFSDPEFINEWIIHFLEEKENTGSSTEGVGAVLQAFDRSVAGAAQGSLPKVTTAIPPEPKSTTQSPTARKENLRPTTTHPNGTNGMRNANGINGTNGMNGTGTHSTNSPSTERPTRIQPLEDIRNGGIPNGGHNSFEERKSLEMRPHSQNQSPVDSPPHSPVDTSLKRTPSSTGSHASVSELSMTSHKTSSESSRSGIYPSQAAEQPKPAPGIGLLNARVTVEDTGPTPDPSKTLKSKPKNLFMIQLEPLSSAGRIVMRTYQDFESLHTTLFSVARISGCEKYLMAFSEEGLPTWKNRSIDELVAMLEFYLRMALSEEHLVKTEALYKFFEKDEVKLERGKQLKQETPTTPWRSSTSLENVGKNILGTITKAPQSASEGGKAFFGGIKKALTSQSPVQSAPEREIGRSPFGFISNNVSRAASRARTNEEDSEVPTASQDNSPVEPPLENRGRFSIQLTRRSPNPPLPPRRSASVAARSSNLSTVSASDDEDTLAQSTPSLLEREPTLESDNITMTFEETISEERDGVSLPPPPSEIDNYDVTSEHGDLAYTPHIPPAAIFEGITETETQYVLELMFSIINELYGLSTAWMIRRSFLNIAKSVILRPGNSQLAGLRNMIQSDVLEANTKPEVIADYIRQVRKNALPTSAEMKEWEETKKPRTEEEKEELRKKARVLLSESLPQGLTALLGVNQTKEAMHQLFDALQERDIARGLWTAILCGTMKFVCQ